MLVVVLRQLLHWGDGRNGGGTEVSSWLEHSGSDNSFVVSGWLCLGTTVLIKTNEKEGKASKSSGQWRAVKGFEAFVFGHR